MGNDGAILATVIGQIFTALLSYYYLIHMKSVKPSKKDFLINIKICKEIAFLGITSFLAQVSLVASMAAVNNMIRNYGALDPVFAQEQYAQIPMAVVGIVMKYFQIVISVVVGLAAGCIPIVGYNMGADRFDRVKNLFSKLLISEAIVGIISFTIVEFFPVSLLNLFGAANESAYYMEFGIKSFRIYLCFIILACINKATFIMLQAMGKAIESTVLSMTREIVFGVGITLILPIFFGLNGVLYSMPVSDFLTFLISIVIIIKTYYELNTSANLKSTSLT